MLRLFRYGSVRLDAVASKRKLAHYSISINYYRPIIHIYNTTLARPIYNIQYSNIGLIFCYTIL